MAEFTDFLAEAGSRLASGLGLKPSDREQLQKWRVQFESDKAGNVDRWEQIKDQIRRLEARLKKLKGEYEASHGMVKEMVGQQIEAAFQEMDRKKDSIKLVKRNLDSLSTFLDRISELEHAKAGGITETHLDALAGRLEEGFDEVQQADKAMKDLNRIGYEGPEKDPMDVDERLRKLEDAEESTPGLSQSTAERLKQLERETED